LSRATLVRGFRGKRKGVYKMSQAPSSTGDILRAKIKEQDVSGKLGTER